MKKKFITNIFLILFLNFLVKPFWVLGIDRTVQNVVGAAEYGFYFSLFSFSIILNMLLDFGITNFNNRTIARDHKNLASYLSNIVVLKFLLSIIYFIVSFTIAFIIGYDSVQMKLLVILVINQFIASFILYMRSNISGMQLFRTDSFLSVLDRALMIIICGVLLWGNITEGKFRIEWFVYAQTGAYLLTLIVSFMIVLSKAAFFRPGFNSEMLIKIIKSSYPYALLSMFMIIYVRIDSVMLERMLDDGGVQAGIYAQSYRILDAASMVGYLFAGILLPMFSKMIKQKQSVEELTYLSFLLLIIPAILVSIGSLFFRKEIISLLYDSHIAVSADIFGILMLAFIPVSAGYIFGSLLTANGNLKTLNLIAISGVIMNVILNLILIPKFQALGSAKASLITQSITVVVQVIAVYRIMKFKPGILSNIRLAGYFILVVILGFLVSSRNFFWVYELLIFGLLGVILAWSVRLLKPASLMRILRQE
ncbi:MAG: oligosaccharide flippase family protein [Bacteroidetes bacterium]|nr:oligosaccharide flippase family protein [Bacteroidota bacterium]